MIQNDSEKQSALPIPASGHEKHCFIVMPYGRDSSEQKWFKGWYEVVIKPAVMDAGYEPKLSAAEEQPGAINDEIRAHLALDSMVVVDLGGAEPEEDPNPNVMYELGIRHALGLPLVMMAWKGQRLPFDVSNQRIIMEDRDLMDLETNRKRLIAFIHSAQQGNYYRPMDAVGRIATIAAASENLGEDSLLRALAYEVRDLRTSIAQATSYRIGRRPKDYVLTVKKMVNGKVFRKELYPFFEEIGGDPNTWARILRIQIDSGLSDQMQEWGAEEWKHYIKSKWEEIKSDPSALKVGVEFDMEIMDKIKDMLPAQPWPSGVHREISEKLEITPNLASRYIRELIRKGDFLDQIDGRVFSATK
jgi:ribosomal protein S25